MTETNPYEPPSGSANELVDDVWPQIRHRDGKRIRQLARDGRRPWLSLLAAPFFGLLTPFIFLIFFTGHYHSHVRLGKRYATVLADLQNQRDSTIEEFIQAGPKFRTARNIYGLIAIPCVVVFCVVIFS
ncbi:MAG: hypothetical protein AAF802_14110 [Planctomycetota bacterium]